MKITVGQLLGIIVLIVIIGVGAFLGTKQMKDGGKRVRQAVFLTNNQVYFGYVSNPTSQTVVLRDIYYLQVQQSLQQGSNNSDNSTPQVSLVKLGKELHGPKDEMRINRDHILFIEDMQDDSKVNQTIAEYIKSNGATATPTPSPAQ